MEIKPQAALLPKDTSNLEKGKYGPIYPKTPACYGFTIIAKVKPGTSDVIRGYGNKLATALESEPYLLAPLKLHYLRWVLFDDLPDDGGRAILLASGLVQAIPWV